MGRPRIDLSRWQPGLPIIENAKRIKVSLLTAYSLANRYHLVFLARKRGIKHGTVVIRKPVPVPMFSYNHINMSDRFGMGEGAD
jgi:hypothetical protein